MSTECIKNTHYEFIHFIQHIISIKAVVPAGGSCQNNAVSSAKKSLTTSVKIFTSQTQDSKLFISLSYIRFTFIIFSLARYEHGVSPCSTALSKCQT